MLTSYDIPYGVMSGVVFSTDQLAMKLPNLQEFKTEHSPSAIGQYIYQ
jgi:hypothetical protein